VIARLWHGRTHLERADAYAAFLNERAIPDYRGIPGNVAVHVLRRDEGRVTHFYTFTLWESLEAIRNFAGSPIEQAKYYPEDRDFLLEFEPQATHWEVTGTAQNK
jgi:heme-degrading monooxygenase HmoA